MEAAKNLEAQTVEEAKATIRGWVKECAEGKGDRELEAIGLAALWSIDLADVRKAFKDARDFVKAPVDVGFVQREPIRGLNETPESFANRRRKWRETLATAKATIELKVVEPKISPETKTEAEDVAGRIGLPAVIPETKAPSTERVHRYEGAMAAMNEQHAIIENYGNKAVIASWEPTPTNLDRKMLVFQGKESFMLRYSNRSVELEASDGVGGFRTIRLPLGGWWLSHRDRPQHRGITFKPGALEVVSDCLNMW